jgi:hypothetical protein
VAEEVVGKCKEVATNGNGLGIELISKNSKAQLGNIKIVVHVNKMVPPLMEKLDFLRMNS